MHTPAAAKIEKCFRIWVRGDQSHFFALAPELFGNLHSDSCLHSKNLKAMSILPLETK